MDTSHLRFVFPNAITLASVLCAMSSMYVVSSGAGEVSSISLGAWLLIASMVCDAADGRVARIFNAQSEFGVQLDSLADAISFGVAPAWLVFHWGLTPLGFGGVVVSFVYVGCALMRLARFNVAAASEGAKPRFFTGLPSPLAAGALISVVLAHVSLTSRASTFAFGGVAILTVLVGLLMVSNVRYRTFKDVKLAPNALAVILTFLTASLIIGAVFSPAVSIVFLIFTYVLGGLTTGVMSLGRALFIHDREDLEELDELDDHDLVTDDDHR